jgi:single-strand DNA-binding protein
MSVNKCILIGNVGKDAEVADVNGFKVAKFSLATTEKGYTTKEGKKVEDKTEWHNIVAWRGLAELAEKWIKKGSQLYIEGKISYRSWEKDGVTHYATDIIAENIQLLGSKPESGKAPEAEKPKSDLGINASSDLPF